MERDVERLRRTLDTLILGLGRELPAHVKGPGTWMHDALEVRDDWESRLLRSAAWSPLG